MILTKTKLFFLCFTPTACLLLLLALQPEAFKLSIEMTVISGLGLISAVAIYIGVNHSYINPSMALLDQLERGPNNINSDVIEVNTLSQSLALSFAAAEQTGKQLLSQNITDFEDTISHLTKLNTLLESRFHNSNLTFEQFQTDCIFQSRYSQLIASLFDPPLMTLIAISNAQQRSDEIAKQTKDNLKTSTKQLLFLINELQQHSYLIQEEKNFDVQDICDDVLAVLHPLLEKHRLVICMNFDASCSHKFNGKPELLKAMLFNFLVTHLIGSELLQRQVLEVVVSFRENKYLNFCMGPASLIKHFRSHARLDELALCLDANVTNGDLRVFNAATHTPIRRITRPLTVGLATNHGVKTRGLASRLRSLGLTVSHVGTEKPGVNSPNFYLLALESFDDINKVSSELVPDIPVYYISSTSFYKDKNWHALNLPINQLNLFQNICAQFNPQHRYRILVVDDHASNLKLLKLMLVELGHEIIKTSSPKAAIEWCQSQHFDFIFMDLQMPEMGGTEASSIIRRNGFKGPIVALTAHIAEFEKKGIFDAGMTDAMLKPVTKQKLEAVLEAHLLGQFSQTSSPSTELEIFNLDLALERANNKQSLADELLALLMASLKEDQNKLNQAFNTDFSDVFRAELHKLHGALRYCGAEKLEATVSQLETLAKADTLLQGENTLQTFQQLMINIEELYEWHSQQ